MFEKPFTFVLFGATGDLAQKKIIPALCSLFEKGKFVSGTQVICYSRRAWSNEEYREFIRPSLHGFYKETSDAFLNTILYLEGTFDTIAPYEKLKSMIATEKTLYHFAVQPQFYEVIAQRLARVGLTGTVLIEKPFGHDEASAIALESLLETYFASDHIFRIDHYLGKAGLDAFWELRLHDEAFESHLNSNFVKEIHIRLLEHIDIGDRGEFFDVIGAVRDVGQNHALETLAVVLLDHEIAREDKAQARAQALEQLMPLTQELVRGQYKGYRDTSDVHPQSETETYFKITAKSDSPRWSLTTIILEGGKAMHKKQSEIRILYHDGSESVFNLEYPKTVDAYEVVIDAALKGEMDRFVSFKEVLASWHFIDPLVELMKHTTLCVYEKGSITVQC